MSLHFDRWYCRNQKNGHLIILSRFGNKYFGWCFVCSVWYFFFMKFSTKLLQAHRYTETRVYSLIIQRSHIHLSFGYTSNCILGLIIFNYHVVRSLLSYKYMLRFFFRAFWLQYIKCAHDDFTAFWQKKKTKKIIRIENSQEQIDKFLVNLNLISVLYYSFFSVFRELSFPF